ncbi:MAG: GNAT family N-acetyltransferase [Verrucomicrobiota bacterium]
MDVQKIDLALSEDRRRYDDLFEQCPQAFIQQSTDWADVISGMGPDEPMFLIASENSKDVAGLPLYLFRGKHGNILTSVPQNGPLGGVFHHPSLNEAQMERAYQALLTASIDFAKQMKCLTLTIMTNPFIDDRRWYECYFEPDMIFENFTQYTVIQEVYADGAFSLPNRQKMRSHLISVNRKCEEAHVQVGFCDSLEDWNGWYEIHQKRQTEIGAAPLSSVMAHHIFEKLIPKKKAHLLIAKKEHTVIAGILYIRHQEIMDTLAISMDSDYRHLSPNYLITEHSIPWAAKMGVKIYNWQSMPHRQNGVYAFKKKWGGKESLYYFMTKIFCDSSTLLDIGVHGLKEHYQGHYVVPFAALEDGFSKQFYAKA